jgi:hypothetical protein
MCSLWEEWLWEKDLVFREEDFAPVESKEAGQNVLPRLEKS